MKFENTEVFNFAGAIRGMRNPKESWSKSDSDFAVTKELNEGDVVIRSTKNNKYHDVVNIGKNDLKLMQTLIKAGSEHRKFMRQIFVCVDITAPLYFWKEESTYKIGTTENSTSTMHKLADTPITIDCFEMGDFEDCVNWEKSNNEIISHKKYWENVCVDLEKLRLTYNETKDKRYWKELIRLLPESWLQKRTITMNYENLLNICSKGQRRFHKLSEWSKDFISWARTLPYAQELIFLDELKKGEKND